jgi:hypothetical protein
MMKDQMTAPLGGRRFFRNAAGFSALAPLLALFLNFAYRNQAAGVPLLTYLIGGASFLLILVGLAAAFVGLFGVRTHGKEGIFVYALIGLCLNSLALLALVLFFVLASQGNMPTPGDLGVRTQLIGVWENRTTSSAGESVIDLELREDGKFHFQLTGDGIADFSGTWRVQNKRLYLQVDAFVEGNREAVGSMVRWSIDDITPSKITFGAKNGQEVYIRKN